MAGRRGRKPNRRQEARIILVEREPNLEQRLRLLFPEADGAHITRESSIDRVLERFESDTYDVLIITGAAFKAGEVDGIELLDVIAAKARDVLDERTRWHRLQGIAAESIISWPYSGWEERALKLFQTAAEAAKAIAAEK